MTDGTINISPEGEIRFVWHDSLQGLLALGKSTVKRASHVEPNEDGHWTADMSPSGGGTLGPFKLRGEALAAEVNWLRENDY
jgi:hypothetical protein